MHIRQLKIDEFKSFKSVEFNFNPDLNVLTGVNNSGKTTVLEAVALWVECFRKRIWQAGKADNKQGLKRGQYRLDREAYIEIESVRSPNFGDIFHDLTSDTAIVLEAVLADEDSELTIGFSIRSARGGNYIVNLKDTAHFSFPKFNDFFDKFPDPFNIIYASPVATLLPREDFETIPKLKKQVNTRQSMQVLRNRLYQLKKDSVRFRAFSESVGDVLSDGMQPVEFFFDGDETRDVGAPVRVRVGAKDVEKDISLLGSGTVQIVEIMLAVHAEQRDLNIILLDEPDSHIHRDIQRRLVNKLKEHTGKTQVFLTTHNESLIRSTRAEHLFHLESRQTKVYWPVYREKASGQRHGLQPSRQLKILKTLGSETSIDFLNAIEAERLVLVEGEDDARFIQAIVERAKSPPTPFHAMYWSFGGIDTILQRIKVYKEVFQQFKNDKTLWDKAVLVVDRDYLDDSQRAGMMEGLAKSLGIPVYVSTSYTMEATILSDVSKLKMLLAQLVLNETKTVVDPVVVDRLVNEGVAKLTAKLKGRLDDPAFHTQQYYRLTNRRKKLLELDVKAISKSDGSLTPDFSTWFQAKFVQGKIHLLANKDDVTDLIAHVYQGLAISFQPGSLFERLIEAATSSTWFDEWKELRAAVM